MTRRISLIGALAVAGASSFFRVQGAAAQGAVDWADLEGRIQYAYYTNDARSLNGLLTSLTPKGGAEGETGGEAGGGEDKGTRAYFRALANYRLAQVLTYTKQPKARDAIGKCNDEVDDVVDVGSSRVDLQACKLEYSIVSPK